MNVHAMSVGQTDVKSKGAVGGAGTRRRWSMPQTVVADPKKVGQRIKDLRNASSQTQADVAEAIGIARSTYAELENGTGGVSIESILAIADYFKVPLDWLLIRTPPPDGPLVGYFVDHPGEIAWIELLRGMGPDERNAMLAMLRRGTSGRY
jgi:transcriptional regulator with XRE-family HTH domain